MNWRHFLLFLTLLTSVTGRESALRSRPPVLNIEAMTSIAKDSNLTLICEGARPVKWLVPRNGNNETFGREVKDGATPSDSLGRVYKYESIFVITRAEFYETGYYTCCYQQTDCQRGENASSAYIFVNDEDHIFIMSSAFGIFIHHGQKAVLPCRSTFSDSNVTLWKESEYVPLTEDILYDPREGFVLNFPTIFFDGLFYCKAAHNGTLHDVTLHLFYLAEPSPIEPFIESNKGTNFPLVNSSFSLNCSMRLELESIAVTEWNFPNKASGDGRIEEKDSYAEIRVSQQNFKYKFVTTELLVRNARLNDSGVYECVVTDHSKNKYSIPKTIQVYELTEKPYLNLINDIEKPIERKKNSHVFFSVTIQSFPYFENIDLNWAKDGKPLLPDKRYEIKVNNFRASLKITSLRITDDGVYTLTATTGNITNSTSITLYILGKPEITITDSRKFYSLNRNYEIHCETKGYPKPTVWWRWKKSTHPENSYNLDDEAGWIDVELGRNLPNVVNTTMITNGNILVVVGKQSGHYRCKANNDMGESEETISFFVTDAKRGFEVITSNENPVEMDRVWISCKASSYHYKAIYWMWKEMANNEIQLSSNSSLDLEVIEGNTVYSKVLTIKFNAITFQNNGTYTCVAIPSNKTYMNESKVIHLEVTGIEKPSLIGTNMNKSVITVSSTMHFEFLCYVQGVPFPNITWFKDGKIFDDSNMSGVELTHHFQKLTINRVVERDAGLYRCLAENRGGSVSEEITLRVIKEDMHMAQKMTVTERSIIIFVVILVLVLLFLTFMLVKKVYREKKEKKEMEFLSKVLFDKGQIEMFNPEMSLEDQVELLPYDHRWEFPKERLKLGKTLGQGAFGRVVKAEAIGIEDGETSTTVAVKMLKERADVTQRKALMAELKILIHLGRHLNIVNLLGAVTKNVIKGELMVIVEYCCYGNLRHYLLEKQSNFINQLDPTTDTVDPTINSLPGSPGIENIEKLAAVYESAFSSGMINSNQRDQSIHYVQILHRQRSYENQSDSSETVKTTATRMLESGSGDTNQTQVIVSGSESKDSANVANQPVTTCDLLCFAFQAARGMEYLASKKLIHRDLAARNVLLAEDNVVKICDFGLAKDCYKYSNYVKKGNGPLPIKWMAIESIRDKVFTCKSDVWSFGILLWEFFTLGGNPYPGIDIDEEFYKRLKNGYRMEKPDYAPKSIYNIMQDCWDPEPTHRPDFTELSEKIGMLLEASVRKYYIELNMPYMVMNKELMNNNEYLLMSENGNADYMNVKDCSSENKKSAHYDDVGAIRPVNDGPVPTVPMEVVPMIQFEPITDKAVFHLSLPKSQVDLLSTSPPDSQKSSDYLCMDSPKDVNDNCLQTSGSFFLDQVDKNEATSTVQA